MFKSTFKQLRVYLVGYIGTFVTLVAISILGMISCELLGGSIIDVINNGYTIGATRAISMFGTICGFLILLGISSLVMASNYSVKRRWKSFSNLRVISNTYKDIRKMIVIETFFLSIFALLIGIPIGVEVTHPILNYFENATIISSGIQVTWNIYLILITSAVLISITLITVLIVSRKLKKISIDQVKDVDEFESKKMIFFKVIVGLGFILTPVIIFNVLDLEGGNGQIYMAIGLFVPVLGFAISGKYIYKSIIFVIRMCVKKGTKISYFLGSFNNALSKIINVTTSIAFIITFQGILLTSANTLALAKETVAKKLYENLNTYKPNNLDVIASIKVDDASIIYNVEAKVIDKVKENEIIWKNTNIEVVKGVMPYNLNYNVDGVEINKDEVILTTDFPNLPNVGSMTQIIINDIIYDLKVKAIIPSPLKRTQFTSIYVGFDPNLITSIKTEDVVVVSKNELVNSDLSDYNVLSHIKIENNASETVSNLIQWMVIIFSLINISNFLLLFIYDKKNESQLKNILGATPRIVTSSMVLQTGIVATLGVLVGVYSTLTFTIPYINANPINVPFISSPITFSLICVGIVFGSMLFAYIIAKITIKRKVH